MSKYIAAYEALCPDDKIAIDDPRRANIIAEMKLIEAASCTRDACAVVDWWHWESQAECTRWVNRARRLMAKGSK